MGGKDHPSNKSEQHHTLRILDGLAGRKRQIQDIGSAPGMGLTWGFAGVSLLNFEIFDMTGGEIANCSWQVPCLVFMQQWSSRRLQNLVRI